MARLDPISNGNIDAEPMIARRLFLFDLDGTLVSTGGAGLRALSKAFQNIYGIENAHTTVDPSGKTDPAIFREIHRHHFSKDVSSSDISQISECYLSHLEQEMKSGQTKILQGVQAFIEKVCACRDIVMGLGTGNLEKGARLKLGPVNLNKFFSFGGFGSDAEDRAEVLKWGHRRAEEKTQTKITPADVFIIGDTLLDIAAAKRAGFQSVGVATGAISLETLHTGEPDFVFSNLSHGESLL